MSTNVSVEGSFLMRSSEYMLAKSLFDCSEFERLVDTFEVNDCSSVDIVSLCLLAEHLLIQKKESTTHDKSMLLKKAEVVYSRFSNDSIINYLYAMILRQCETMNCTDLVQDLLLRSVRLEPWNWAAWMELAALPLVVDNTGHPLYPFYMLERLKNEKKHKAILRQLESATDKYSIQLRGYCYHELRQFTKAVAEFETLAKKDPYRLDGMDIYSNCLFVLEQEEQLTQLAQFWMKISPNAFETCIIGGNFFSLKADHEKAAVLFKRATVLSPSNINALLLLGHELVELRNPSAALAVYQQAILVGKTSDSRPFYAIGQLFELINQYAFAVYYFEKASHIDKSDTRIWTALASCYKKLNRPELAKSCMNKLKEVNS